MNSQEPIFDHSGMSSEGQSTMAQLTPYGSRHIGCVTRVPSQYGGVKFIHRAHPRPAQTEEASPQATPPSLIKPIGQYEDPSTYLTPGPPSRPTSKYGYITPVNQGLSRAVSNSSLFAGFGETPNSHIDINLTVNQGLRRDVSNSSRLDQSANLEEELPSSMLFEAQREPTAAVEPPIAPKKYQIDLSYVTYSAKPIDPTKGATAPKHRGPPTYIMHQFKSVPRMFDLTNTSFGDLKNKLFMLADIADGKEKGDGLSSIFKSADATDSVVFSAIISKHPTFAQIHKRFIKDDDDVKEFFEAVKNSKVVGVITTAMVDPKQKAKEAEQALALAQNMLQSQNVKENRTTSISETAHKTIPLNPVDKHLADLMERYGNAHNNSAEGYRIYKRGDVTKVQQLSWAQMLEWAEIMDAGTDPAVTIEDPPENHDGFQWVDLKGPLSDQTPLKSDQSHPVQNHPVNNMPEHGSVAEAQGYKIVVDPYELDRIREYASMSEYLAFARIRPQKWEEVTSVLAKNKIYHFDAFVYPKMMNICKVVKMGIGWGIAVRLFACARRFYEHILDVEEDRPQFDHRDRKSVV